MAISCYVCIFRSLSNCVTNLCGILKGVHIRFINYAMIMKSFVYQLCLFLFSRNLSCRYLIYLFNVFQQTVHIFSTELYTHIIRSTPPCYFLCFVAIMNAIFKIVFFDYIDMYMHNTWLIAQFSFLTISSSIWNTFNFESFVIMRCEVMLTLTLFA